MLDKVDEAVVVKRRHEPRFPQLAGNLSGRSALVPEDEEKGLEVATGLEKFTHGFMHCSASDHSRSMSVPVPSPPPQHIVTSP